MGNIVPLIVMIVASAIGNAASQRFLEKRSAIVDALPGDPDYPDYALREEPYQVPPKRAAMLLDRLMVALQNAVDKQARIDSGSSRSLSRGGASSQLISNVGAPSEGQPMDLQRRGQAKGRVYWRCYFNAVACFRRK